MHTTTGGITATFETVTPELATEWLGLNEGNRNKRTQQVAKIARAIKRDRFLITGDTIKFDTTGRLIDGQHRLSAIVDTDTPVVILIVRGVDPDVQLVIDENAKRSARDAARFKDLSFPNIVAPAARIGIARNRGGLKYPGERAVSNLSNDEAVTWILENQDIAEGARIASAYRKSVPARPAALAYAAMELLRVDAEAAEEFFAAIHEMRLDGTGDPRLTLVRFLESAGQNEHPEARIALGLYAIFHAWNHWREGKELRVIRTQHKGQPLAIPEPK